MGKGKGMFGLTWSWCFIVVQSTGDVFVKLKNEDDQGWCVGEKEGRVGLYPKDYVEII